MLKKVLISGVAMAALLAGCGDDDDTATEEAPTVPAEGDAPETTDGAAADTGGDAAMVHEIIIQDFAYGDPMTVAAGDEVTVTNNDGPTHTLTSDDGAFDTGNVDSGASATLTIADPGEYTFHCEIHPSMTGSITVQ